MKNNNFLIPSDVPSSAHQEYLTNYQAITQNSDRLMLFACDQKIEHLNNDFYGATIHPDALQPTHLFTIASQGEIGAMAAHLGLIARYGQLFPNVNYVVKLNGKTDLIPKAQKDPLSKQLWSVDDVVQFKKNSGLLIRAVGITLYIGSEFEPLMLEQAAQAIYRAHRYGLLAIVWVYPRGNAVDDDTDPQLLAGAAGIATALGADFVKIKSPEQIAALRIATVAAGNTKIICSGGSQKSPQEFLQQVYDEIHIGGAAGAATGRNIFQRSTQEAIALTHALNALVVHDQTVEKSLSIYHEKTA